MFLLEYLTTERIGTLIGIYVSPKAGGEMVELTEAEVIETGVKGDRYAENSGTWQIADRKKPLEARKNRGVSGVSIEDISEGNSRYGTEFEPQDTRRTFVFEGTSNFQQFLGKTMQIGETVQIEWTHDCDACSRPSSLSQKPGYKDHGSLGGVRGNPKKDKLGIVKKGDPVFVI